MCFSHAQSTAHTHTPTYLRWEHAHRRTATHHAYIIICWQNVDTPSRQGERAHQARKFILYARALSLFLSHSLALPVLFTHSHTHAHVYVYNNISRVSICAGRVHNCCLRARVCSSRNECASRVSVICVCVDVNGFICVIQLGGCVCVCICVPCANPVRVSPLPPQPLLQLLHQPPPPPPSQLDPLVVRALCTHCNQSKATRTSIHWTTPTPTSHHIAACGRLTSLMILPRRRRPRRRHHLPSPSSSGSINQIDTYFSLSRLMGWNN